MHRAIAEKFRIYGGPEGSPAILSSCGSPNPTRLGAARRRGGLTLIELLAVISILGLLMALVLPAILQAREAAARVLCRCRLKQIGVALHNYHDQHGSFPIGARRQGGLGPSWWVGALPQLDLAALYNELDLSSANCGLPILNSNNLQKANNRTLTVMLCPSSTVLSVPKTPTYAHTAPSYVGISGATADESILNARLTACCGSTAPGNSGFISAAGMLIPNQQIRISEVTDGTTQTILVGEASGSVYDHTGKSYRMDGAHPISWLAGTAGAGTPPLFFSVPASPMTPPCYNITTIRHAPNTRDFRPLEGMAENHGANNPLSSMHRGGVHVLLADGSARFLADGVNLTIFKQLASRDDGNVFGEW